eukprot:6213059-Pleurochrysis_carterae.AAC.6
MQNVLRECGLSIDLRTMEEGRQVQDKFYEGGEWQRFCCGGGLSPGGPVIIAKLVKIIADYFQCLARQVAAHRAAAEQARGLAAVAAAAATSSSSSLARPSKRKREGADNFLCKPVSCQHTVAMSKTIYLAYHDCRAAGRSVAYAKGQNDEEEPSEDLPWLAAFNIAKEKACTQVELEADVCALQAIRDTYQESAERLIAMLLTFDASFAFRKVMRLRFDAPTSIEKEKRALDFARAHRTFWEQLERVTGGDHKSQYPHAVQLKAVAQMAELGDLWAYSFSALESYHAEVGRLSDRTGCKRVNADADGKTTVSSAPVSKAAASGEVKEGPSRRVEYATSTTMASSVATRLVAARALSHDDELCIQMRAQQRIALAPSMGGGAPRRFAQPLAWGDCSSTQTPHASRSSRSCCLPHETLFTN